MIELVELPGKLNVLRRRLQHLRRQIDMQDYGERSVSYLIAETSALTSVIELVEWATTGIDGHIETNPVSIIKRLAKVDLGNDDHEVELFEVREAATVLAERLRE